MRQYRDELVAMGHLVTSRWIDEEWTAEANFSSDASDHKGLKDIQDINICFGALFFTDVPSTTGGMHVEFGYSLARGRTLIIVGPLRNIFHRQAHYHFSEWEHFKRGYLHAPSKQDTQVQATSGKKEDA